MRGTSQNSNCKQMRGTEGVIIEIVWASLKEVTSYLNERSKVEVKSK